MSDLAWHAADGSQHVQSAVLKDQPACSCGLSRHLLAMAAETRVCPGVAHTWSPGRPCVLCGLSWRVPPGQYILEPGTGLQLPDLVRPGPVFDIGLGAFTETVILDKPACIYCVSLAAHPGPLALHQSRAHQEDVCPAPVD